MNRLSLHLLAYKLAALTIGGLSLFWGYRLFEDRISAQAQMASLKVAHGQSGLELNNAAPGIFFALFGAAIVASVIFRGMTLRAEAAEAVTPESTRGAVHLDGRATQPGRFFIGSDLKKIVHYKLGQVWERVLEMSLTDDDRHFLQMRLADIGLDLDQASKGEFMTEEQPSARASAEAAQKLSKTKFEGFGSAPPD